ncbi:hypothetical protein [Yersinia kristensenii]|uniref:hypothetical protein n=1 Tax=Yersinia kristensenii TaxID=28152 RepID=UPI0015626796|nr:hypothetical protein [Yersinia kristensenii]QKJ17308.1 hypothetical protein HRD70_20270 [Yersinia kristensenii]
MTTIAWDGKTLAADGQSTSGDLICSLKEQKIYYPAGGVEWRVNDEKVLAIGAAGDCGAEFELQEKLANGITYATEFSPAFGFSAIAICGPNRAYLISSKEDSAKISLCIQVDPYALGSGATVAITAIHLGESAIEAVNTAIEMDVYSGGRVQWFSVKKSDSLHSMYPPKGKKLRPR